MRQRYGSNLIHTYGGQTLLLINPMHQLSIYSDKVRLETIYVHLFDNDLGMLNNSSQLYHIAESHYLFIEIHIVETYFLDLSAENVCD